MNKDVARVTFMMFSFFIRMFEEIFEIIGLVRALILVGLVEWFCASLLVYSLQLEPNIWRTSGLLIFADCIAGAFYLFGLVCVILSAVPMLFKQVYERTVYG